MKKFLTEEEYNEVYGNAFIDDAFEWIIQYESYNMSRILWLNLFNMYPLVCNRVSYLRIFTIPLTSGHLS